MDHASWITRATFFEIALYIYGHTIVEHGLQHGGRKPRETTVTETVDEEPPRGNATANSIIIIYYYYLL